ncbi:hypothetical protein B566_EDAN010752 [Ephemera danica]|nr:hypothetical protein B566_EDAN010752 [Ephemera danica]
MFTIMADIWSDKKFLFFLSGSVLQASAYLALQYWRNPNGKNIDEGFEDVSRIEDSAEKKILVLGLEGSGKSSFLAHFTAPNSFQNGSQVPTGPYTSGFNVITLDNDGVTLKISEIGGSVRAYWDNYLQDTDVLVFVVDSTKELATAARELKRLLGDERLAHAPDLPGALTAEQVADALDLCSITPSKHKVRVIATQSPPTSTSVHPSVKEAKQAIFQLAAMSP